MNPLNERLISKEYLVFLSARIFGIIFKPVILLLLIYFGFEELADKFSRFLIVLFSIFSLLSFPYYFKFYQSYFDNGNNHTIHLRFGIYQKDFFLFNLFASPLTFFFSFLIFQDFVIAIACCIILFLEKILDEIQRFQQYSKSFISWSFLFISKTLLPILLCLGFFFTLDDLKFEIYLLSIILVNIAICFLFGRWLNIKRTLKYVFRDVVKFFKRFYGKSMWLYFIATSGIFFIQIDRTFISVFNFELITLSELTLFAQISNLIPLVISFLFVANRRQLLLQHKTSVDDMFLGFKVPLISFLSAVFLITTTIILSKNNLITISFSNAEIILYLCAFAFFSLDQILYENLYWNFDPKKMLWLDLILIIIFVSLTSINPILLIQNFFFVTLLRLLAHLYFSTKRNHN